MDHLEGSTVSRSFNHNRSWWPGVLLGAIHDLQSFDLTSANADRVLILDDTISEKFGKNIESVAQLYDSLAGKCVIAHSVVNLIYFGREIFYALAYEVAIPQAEDMDKAP